MNTTETILVIAYYAAYCIVAAFVAIGVMYFCLLAIVQIGGADRDDSLLEAGLGENPRQLPGQRKPRR